ncbi:3,4-dihydroxy-2-butanone-4-phosphate synthase [Halarcobacter anaerophilus]|jgi:3,4-dihydroxy 2-butanone 4-phosphate synthase|uniref:3,4-dihydroxy-2-butanone 4-phosphate synthase n=1 Tax=Halarcobacter anaerophilus TaxID=877500 RepID=A0A4Q0XXV1_9BACT|nr:3,4-dihydroxy-2-butanone-4-phosphate synthase [Halarcobacter anaerophilus]QDF28810.1 3,4-dihydroxy-2-butanone-4-phosphate synthase [Halarcobacter anaerophilus]RXJ61119.1 3,4-dihydroxy-2-butanone-4-phosphate synthase [Halarcobacter anaerophilus]
MNQKILNWDFKVKVQDALNALQNGLGVVVTDDKNREDEADVIFYANTITKEQMALLIRECSGIVCLCLTSQKVKELNLPMMVQENNSKYQTPFTVTIEAKENVTTGVSAQDRVTTIKAALKKDGKNHIVSPGHVFPLNARDDGVFERQGHTEASVDLMKLAKLEPVAVLCELTNEDGTMTKGEDIKKFAKKFNMPILSVNDIINYRRYIEE